tara:strand:+ start:1306 stop:1578 length:273 start_codon:yes stop_codon:yes gene_type:complete
MGMNSKQQMKMEKKWREFRLDEDLNEEEKDAFDAPIPSQIRRFMEKFINALQKGNLNRRKKLAIMGQVISNLNIEPNELMKYVRIVKKGL